MKVVFVGGVEDSTLSSASELGIVVDRSDGPLTLGLCLFRGLPRSGFSSILVLAIAGEADPDCVGLALASLVIREGSRPLVPFVALVELLVAEAVSGSTECARLSYSGDESIDVLI